jgi:crotonobetainyl-CoA:carnitine CoA-transferase CaiB-like acyl-CoA transferase
LSGARGVVQELDYPEFGSIPVVEHPLNYANADSGFETPPPALGEHTRAVLEDVGYTDAELDDLAEGGVFGRE